MVVDGYEEITRPFLAQFSQSGLAKLHYGTQTRAIDVACGPGTTTLMLAPAVRNVTCVDFSARMLEQLRRNASAAGVRNIDVVEADGQALPFADNSFGLGVSMFGLMFFPDRKRGFAELHRVLTPGGQALVSSWAPIAQSPGMKIVFAALQREDTLDQPPARLSGLEDPTVFEAEMSEAGFIDIRVEATTHGEQVNDAENFWHEMVRAAAPLAMLKRNSSAEEWAILERRAIDRITRQLAGQLPTTLLSTAWLATARKA